MLIKVATYNVNSIRARKELVFMWLERSPVEVLCLQEIKTENHNFPSLDFATLGYKCFVHGQKAYNGVAICSKFELKDLFKGIDNPKFDKESRVIGGRFEEVWLINAYFPHGEERGKEKFYYKLEFYQAFYEFLNKNFKPTDKIILVGDMNVALEDIDVYDPEILRDTIGTMPEERQALRRILEWGFVDSFRFLYPNKVQFTWWDYIGGAVWKNEGMRIDYVLITKPLLENLKDVFVDTWPRKRKEPKPSDHAPVIGVFQL